MEDLVFLFAEIIEKLVFKCERWSQGNKAYHAPGRYVEKYKIDQTGVTASPMRPVGMVIFDGRKVDAVAEDGKYIEKDTAVRISKFNGNDIIVTNCSDVT